jgi:PAS domain S-box-containing protein
VPFSEFYKSKVISQFIANPRTTAIWTGLLLLFLSIFFINFQYKYFKQRHQLEMSILLNTAHKNLEQTLKAAYNSNLALILALNDNGVPENFTQVAADIMRLNPIIDIVELLPNGVVKYVYPLASNEKAIGYDILNTPLVSEEAKICIEKKSIYFAGPLELQQGGLAIVGRYPVYIKEQFWGFSAVIIRFDKLMNATAIYATDNPNYYFQFAKVDSKTKKEIFFLSQPSDFKGKVFQQIFISDGNWNLYIVDKNSNQFYINAVLPYIIICLLLCTILPYFIFIILKKPEELAFINSIQAEKMQRVDAKFQVIFNKTSIAIAQISHNDQTFVEANPQFCTLVSTKTSNIIGKSFFDFIHPEDVATFREFIKTTKTIVNTNNSVVVRLKSSIEGYLWTRIVPSPMLNEGKNGKTIILAIENISDRKIAEEKLIQSELQFKSLFQESPIPLWEEDGSEVKKYFIKLDLLNKDREYVKQFFDDNQPILFELISKIKVLSVNQECLDLYRAKDKYDLIEIFNTSMRLSPTTAITEMLVDICQGLKKGKTQGNVLFADGRRVVFAMTWNIVAGFEDTFGRFIISTEDITAQILAQRLIVASEQKLQSLINSIDGIVWESDAVTNQFTFVSAQAEAILGFKIDDWKRDSNFWENNMHPDDKQWVLSYSRESAKKLEFFNFEYRMVAKNGATVWLRNIVNVERTSTQKIVLKGIMIDITLIKENETDLNQSLAMVTEQNKRLLNFSYIVSHNLRSHTSNIQSLAILIKQSEDLEEQQNLIQLIETVSNDLNDTMINLNEVINIRKNVNINVQSLTLVDFVLKTLDVISEEVRQRKIKIIGIISPEVTVIYNKAYLQSILINVISNAVRYSKKTEENRFIKFKFYQENEFSVLKVVDNGIGINMNRHKDKIFGLYKTFSNNKDAKGIGLFITKNQVEAMGGKIEIESELNVGTTVRIFFKN